MEDTIDDILDFTEKNQDYKPVIGIIKTDKIERSFLTWAAINVNTGDQYIPKLSSIKKLHPHAFWQELTPQELQLFLRTHKQKAFLLSQKTEILQGVARPKMA